MRKNKALVVLGTYLFCAVYLLPMFPHGGSANEMTRWATSASLIHHFSFEISWTEPLIGPNVDTATIGDSVVSNKAPGPAILAAPVYSIVRLFVGDPDESNIRVSWFAMRFAISTLPLLLLAFWVYRRTDDSFALTALLFATPLFLYSLLFFSHVLSAVCLYVAFRLAFDSDRGSDREFLLAGLLSGIAVLSEFPAVAVVGVFAVGSMFRRPADRYRPLLFYVVGGIPFLAFLLVYNNSLFGSPFSMSYSYESFPEWAEVAGQGLWGVGFPSVHNLYLLLLSPSRGLFFFSPLLALSLFVLVRDLERTDVRKVVRLVAVAASVLILSGHGAAHGGWSAGPRYLVFIIPLMLDPILNNELKGIPVGILNALLTASIVLSVIPALTFPFAPPEFSFPHNEFWLGFLLYEGWVVPNMLNVIGFSSGLWNLLPVMLAIILLAVLAHKKKGSFVSYGTGSVAAVLLLAVWFSLPFERDGSEATFRRDAIAERYFKPAERLNKFTDSDVPAKSIEFRSRVQSMLWTIADARAYAPDDFPYLQARPLPASPSALMKEALVLQRASPNDANIERTLMTGRDRFPFARCEFSSNLAVYYYSTAKKQEALVELESIQALVARWSTPACLRSQFLLASLYAEMERSEDSSKVMRQFLFNSAYSQDAEILELRARANR